MFLQSYSCFFNCLFKLAAISFTIKQFAIVLIVVFSCSLCLIWRQIYNGKNSFSINPYEKQIFKDEGRVILFVTYN